MSYNWKLTLCLCLWFLSTVSCSLNEKIEKPVQKVTQKSTEKLPIAALLRNLRNLEFIESDIAQEATRQLDTVSIDNIYEAVSKMLESRELPRAMQEAIEYCHGRAPKRIRELLPAALRNSSPRVLSEMFVLLKVEEIELTPEEIKSIRPFLNHESISVRLHAAPLLRGQGLDQDILNLAANSLSCEEQDPYDDILIAAFYAEALLCEWKPKEVVMEFIRKYKPTDEPTKYRLIDVYAILVGKTERYIYNCSGPPTKEMIKKLDKLAVELNLHFGEKQK